jgi:hypothetical protein
MEVSDVQELKRLQHENARLKKLLAEWDRHLSHLHHVVRFKSDRAWPAPVWGRFPAVAYRQAALAEIWVKLASAALAGFEFLGPD